MEHNLSKLEWRREFHFQTSREELRVKGDKSCEPNHVPVVPLGDTDPTSVLSYSQRHYDTQVPNYSYFVVRVLRIY